MNESIDLSGLFTPITIGATTLKNRFVMPGMQRGWMDDGLPRPELADYYRRRAEGGAALIVSESCAIDHPSATRIKTFGRLNAATAAAWGRCATEVRGAGGQFILQLWHEGAVLLGDEPDPPGHPRLSASGLAAPGHEAGRAATVEEIDEIRAEFVTGALRAQEIGCTGVEVHGAHGFFLDQFLWAGSNRRTDRFGGPAITDRARLVAEIVEEIRAATGPDFLISLRFSQWKESDFDAHIVESPEELGAFLALMRGAGVDVFHVSARRFFEPEWPGEDLGLAGWASRLTDVPIIAVGSVGLDIDVMSTFEGKEAHSTGEQGLAELARRFNRGDFALVSVGRSQIADPDWVNKVRAGALGEIRTFARTDLASTT